MNRIYKSLLVLAAAATVASCDLNQVGEIYLPENDDPTMLYSSFNEIELSASLESIAIPVVRAKNTSELTVDLVVCVPEGVTVDGTAGTPDKDGNTLYTTSLKFDAGKSQADLVLDISKMEVGNKYKGYVVFADDVKFNERTAVDSCAFTLAKAYSWVSLGEGEYYDSFIGNYNPVEVLKADGFDRYRVLTPYPADVLLDDGYAPAGQAFGIGGAPCPYIEFWVVKEGEFADGNHIAWSSGFSTTIDYDGAGSTIYMWFPGDYNAAKAPKAAECKFMDDAKTWIQFYALAYIPALGGGFGEFPTYLSLPGGPKLSDVLK